MNYKSNDHDSSNENGSELLEVNLNLKTERHISIVLSAKLSQSEKCELCKA